MTLRNDPTLWFNLPGVVGAYQPVMAPDCSVAKTNIADGGKNRYTAIDSGQTTWSPFLGWRFNGTTYFNTKISGHSWYWTMIVSFTDWTESGGQILAGAYNASSTMFLLGTYGMKFLYNGNRPGSTSSASSMVAGMAGLTIYLNGKYSSLSDSTSPFLNSAGPLGLGARGDSPLEKATANMRCAVFYSRTLTPSEMWSASQQITYCHVNSDWSAWGRRRRWYYAPSALLAMRRRQADAGRVGSRGVIE